MLCVKKKITPYMAILIYLISASQGLMNS